MGRAHTAALAGSVTIDPSAEPRPYDRMLFGGFIEHFHRQVYGGIFDPGSRLADARGFRLDVIRALRELGLPIVRWPGGCFASAYHWKDGIGPRREPVYDKAWLVEEPNTFGTDEFVAWCRLVGCEPYICTNAGTGTPEEMSDWVEYANLEGQGRWARLRRAGNSLTPHHVRFWSVGNENYGGWETGAKTLAEWGPFVRESAKMMRKVDPSIRLLAAALPDREWTASLLRCAGAYLDMVSIHGYWDPLWQEDRPSDYRSCVTRALEPESAIAATEKIIDEAGFRGRVSIAFDEWNLRGWHHPGHDHPIDKSRIAARDQNDLDATYTMADAVFSAGFLNTCLRHGDTVRMACVAPVVNARGPIHAHPGGIVLRTTYHVLLMYARLLGSHVLPAGAESDPLSHDGRTVPALDAVATCDGSGCGRRLALVNRHPDLPMRCRISSEGRELTGVRHATVLSGDSPDAWNGIEAPERVVPRSQPLAFAAGAVELAPHSVTVLELEWRGP